MKLLLRVLLVAVVLLLLAAGAAFLLIDSIAKTAIERGATYATGVETKVASVDASIFSGQFALEGLSLANPPGFRDEPFVRLGSLRADWQNGSLLSETLEMDTLVVDGVDLNLERGGSGTNYGKILESLEKLSKGEKEPEPAPSEKKRVLAIKRIEIKNVNAGLHLTSGPLPGSMSVSVPSIVIDDFRSDGSTKEIVAKLTRVLLKSILDSVLKAGGGIFPADLLKDLGQQLGSLEFDLEGNAEDVLQDIQGAIKGAGDILKLPKKK